MRSTRTMSRDAPVLWPNIITVREDSRDRRSESQSNLSSDRPVSVSVRLSYWLKATSLRKSSWQRSVTSAWQEGARTATTITTADKNKVKNGPGILQQRTRNRVFVLFHVTLICTLCLFLFTRQAENEKRQRMEAEVKVCWLVCLTTVALDGEDPKTQNSLFVEFNLSTSFYFLSLNDLYFLQFKVRIFNCPGFD